MAKTKILYIIAGNYFDNDHRKLLSVIRNLKPDKYEFSIVCSENLLFMEYLKPFNVPVYAIELPGRIRTRFSGLIAKLQDGEKFDIVHSFGYNAGIYSRLLKKTVPGIKCIHSPSPLVYIEKENFMLRQVILSTEQYLSQFTDIIICENNTDKQIAVKYKFNPKNIIEVIPNSVNISQFANRKKNTELLRQLGFDKNNLIIGNVSNFDKFDNQQVIIRSAYYILKTIPLARFIFIGKGKELKRMQDLVKISALDGYVIFAEEEHNIYDYYSIMEMFILSDLCGGSSAILLEAMSSRLPVICSLTGSYLPYLKEEINSLTFDPTDMDDLFEKMCYLADNKETCDSLAQNAQIDATQYDDSVIFPKIEAIYNGDYLN